MAFEALTGRRPFVGESFGDLVIAICTDPIPVPSRVAPVPAGFDEWFVHATQRDRSRRFASAREMAEELSRVASGEAKGGGSYTGRHRSITPMLLTSSAPPARATTTTTGGGLARSSDDLKLTTGQRAVLSRGSSQRPAGGMSPALLGLLGAGALIVVAVGVFVVGGGARAFREANVAASSEPLPLAAQPMPVAPAASSVTSASPSAGASSSLKRAPPFGTRPSPR